MKPGKDKLLLGYQPFSEGIPSNPKPILDDGMGHLITIAPTGAGKGRSVIIPQLIHYEGSTVVIDPKGENVAVTYRGRKEMGHEVVVLDPFHLTKFPKAGICPTDICHFAGADPETECQLLAEILGGKGFSSDPYWDIHAKALIANILSYLVIVKKSPEGIFGSLRKLLCEDPAYSLAKILDSEGKDLPLGIYEGMAGYLNIPSDKTRPCIDSSAVSYLTSLMSDHVNKMLEKTTFNLEEFVAGKPMDIFIVFPPDKMRSHKSLLKLIVATLFKAIISRKVIPKQKTLFLLDETAALGTFEDLETMVSLCRGYGAIVHSFWQDISQIKRYYLEGYMSIINNANVWQFFGAKHYTIAKEISEITGISAYEIQQLKPDEQVIMVNGKEYKKSKRLDYLKDDYFQGKYDQNPFFENIKTI